MPLTPPSPTWGEGKVGKGFTMRLPKFEYLEPKTLREAAKALASDTKGSVLIAGGTDLLVNMKHRVIQPNQVINLKTIPKLAYISNGKGGWRVGALTTLHDIASSSELQEKYSNPLPSFQRSRGLCPSGHGHLGWKSLPGEKENLFLNIY